MLITTENITCPACKKQRQIEIYPSVNVTLNPEFKEPLMTGELFDHPCLECGHPTRVMYNILYHDMEKRLMVQMAQPDEIEKYEAEFAHHKVLLRLSKSEDYNVRYVTDLGSLITTVNAFDHDLDDRIVNVILFMIWSDYLSEGREIEDGYLIEHEGELLYIFFDDKGDHLLNRFPQEAYDELVEKIEFDHDGNHSLIDLEWISQHTVNG